MEVKGKISDWSSGLTTTFQSQMGRAGWENTQVTQHNRLPMERVRKPIPASETSGWVFEGYSTRNSGRRRSTQCAWELDPHTLLTGSGFPASSLPRLGCYLLSPFLGVDPHLWFYLYCRVRLYPITQASGLYPIKSSSQPLVRLGTPSFPSCPGDMSQPPPWVWLCVSVQLGSGCADHGWPHPCLATLFLLNSYQWRLQGDS